MAEQLIEDDEADSELQSEEDLREELYEQFDVGWVGSLVIRHILPILDRNVEATERYSVDTRSKILADIALYQAYRQVPKFMILVWGFVLIGAYDLLHYLNPAYYGMLIGALASLNGFASSLRSPVLLAAEMEGSPDSDGMPADYRTTAHSSATTNVTMILFLVALSVQMLVTGSVIQGEILTQNVASGTIPFYLSALVLAGVPFVLSYLRESDDD